VSDLHWLPVRYRMQFKIATLIYKTLATCQPSYLCNLLQLQKPSRALRSSTQQLLQVPYMFTDFGRRAFSYSSLATWNFIPTYIKNCSSLYSCKRHLKISPHSPSQLSAICAPSALIHCFQNIVLQVTLQYFTDTK